VKEAGQEGMTPAAPPNRPSLRELASLLREIPRPDAGYARDVRRAARGQGRVPRSP